MNSPLFRGLLQLGDDSLILAQRLCEWCGHAPTIEVDLALSNLALDLIGQATLLLDYAGEIEGRGRDADRLAYHRDAEQFRNGLLVEQPNGDFARTIARQFLFSTFSRATFEQLVHSRDERIAEIAAKALKEVRYHAEFAADWVIRLGDGTEESHLRLADGFDWLWRFVDDVFTTEDDVAQLGRGGILAAPAEVRAVFDKSVAATFENAKLPVPGEVWPVLGGRKGIHTEHLSSMLATMQVLPRAHPEAVW